MTREEAIKLLVNATFSDEWQGNEDLTTAYNMAIKALAYNVRFKALEQGDTISRKDALAEIIRFSTEEGASVECQQLYCDVNNMPSVTPKSEERPKGKWIIRDEKHHYGHICSNCKKEPLYHKQTRDYILSNFCPNCGAEMESE